MAADVMAFGDSHVARAMLARVFGVVPDGYHVVLFRLGPARSVSFTDIDGAADNAAGQPNVWVHVGLSRRPFNGGDRPEALEIDALSGMWADIDIADPVHKKPGLPPDHDAAMAIVRAMRLPPGLIINSGHGLQVWWPFSEVWTFEDAAERRRARILARAWAITIRERAKALGHTVDMVSDISRVLRVAGTTNVKASPVPVVILEQSADTVSEDDVLSVLLDGAWEQAERDIDQKKSSGDQINYGDLILDPSAEPPWEKMDLLREIEPRFDRSWRRVRNKNSESWSPSEWDQSLASYAAQAGWSRQEIANLLLAHRRKHGNDLKTDRQDYYAATINKATAGREEVEAIREAVATVSELTASAPEDRPQAERSDVLQRISKAIGVEITRVTRSRSEPPVFGIETPKGNGSLGGIESIISNRKFRLKVAELTNVIPRKFKDEQWDTMAQGILELAELEELGVESTLAGRAETLVSLYLGSSPPQILEKIEAKSRELLAVNLQPFIGDDGRIRLFATGFKTWMAEVHRESMTPQEVGTMLRSIGGEPETMNFRIPGRRTTRSVWALPEIVKDATA